MNITLLPPLLGKELFLQFMIYFTENKTFFKKYLNGKNNSIFPFPLKPKISYEWRIEGRKNEKEANNR